jgi:predicted ATPase
VLDTTEGNPLFIEETVRMLLEGGGEATGIPLTVKAMISARIDRLPPAERKVLRRAAVTGRTFWSGAIEAIGEDSDPVARELQELVDREFLVREPRSTIRGEEAYRFKHVLIRDVAYELLPRARRRELHEHAARFLEQATSEVGEAGAALARHWRDAGNPERAVDYFVAAAEQEERGWAKDHAAELYREALRLVPEENTERRSELRRRLALAHQAFYHVQDAQLLGLGGDDAS